MDIAAILFTSGTTGLSKGVMMRHAQMYFFAELTAQLTHLTPDDTYMTGFPLFHGNAHFMTVYPALLVGARCVLYERFSASEWVERLVKSGATVTNSIGVTMPFVFAQPPGPLDRAHKLRCAFTAPTPFDILPEFRERFGVAEFPEGFGLTETCMCLMSPLGVERPRGACGMAVSQYFDIKLVDPETDEEVPVGEVGELIMRPKIPGLVTAGYVNMPDKTVESTRNLWFHTGDGLRKDADGWFYFVDRMKDALRRRGENISSFELEATIREHPDVADVAVIAAPSDVEGGEDEIMACLIAEDGAELDFPALVGWCETRLPYFAVPRYFEAMEAFPKTPTERVQKKQLRDRGIAGAWDRVNSGIKLADEVARDAKRRSRTAS